MIRRNMSQEVKLSLIHISSPYFHSLRNMEVKSLHTKKFIELTFCFQEDNSYANIVGYKEYQIHFFNL